MQHCGTRGQVCKWFHSYLTNKASSLYISGANSNLLSILYGVSQGLILGPILLKLVLKFALFADDTSLYY